MFSEIILNTVFVPFVFGLVLFVAAYKFSRFSWAVSLTAGISLLSIYVLLEGWPTLPPTSSKPKVAVLIAGFAILNIAAVGLRTRKFMIVPSMIIAAIIWIGWNRLGDPEMLLRFVALLVPTFIGSWMFSRFKHQNQLELIWPVTLIAFAIGGAMVALFGAYIGFAQMMGAFAAFLGGFSLVVYLLLLIRPTIEPMHLSQTSLQIIFMAMMAVLIAIVLFAPEINPGAITVLGLTLLGPYFQARFNSSHVALRPILAGIIVAIPTGAAIAISAL